VIVEVHHRKLFGERQQRAVVITVVVSRPHVIDLLDAGRLEGLDDAAQIALTGVTGIDQQ
jgi:hypothetical protein